MNIYMYIHIYIHKWEHIYSLLISLNLTPKICSRKKIMKGPPKKANGENVLYCLFLLRSSSQNYVFYNYQKSKNKETKNLKLWFCFLFSLLVLLEWTTHSSEKNTTVEKSGEIMTKVLQLFLALFCYYEKIYILRNGHKLFRVQVLQILSQIFIR